jgi:hypothetical protein
MHGGMRARVGGPDLWLLPLNLLPSELTNVVTQAQGPAGLLVPLQIGTRAAHRRSVRWRNPADQSLHDALTALVQLVAADLASLVAG